MPQPVFSKLVSQSGSATVQRRATLFVMFFRTIGENVGEGMNEVSIVTSMRYTNRNGIPLDAKKNLHSADAITDESR
jgi:hypothetical protein